MLAFSVLMLLLAHPCDTPASPIAEDISVALSQQSPVDDTTELLAALAIKFEQAKLLDRKNVVTNNGTGKPVLKDGKRQHKLMKGVTSAKKLIHAILVDSQLQIDADGNSDSTSIDPDYGQVETSLKWLDAEGARHSVDTLTVPFFVMPYHWYTDQGVQPGDVAAIIYGDRIEYAIFADVGPWQKLGEGSIALHDNLGNNPWTKGGKPWNGIDTEPGVDMVIFPGSRDEIFPTPEGKKKKSFTVYGEPNQARIRKVGEAKLEALLGNQVNITPKTTPTKRPVSEQ
jgi:hypothetical protein